MPHRDSPVCVGTTSDSILVHHQTDTSLCTVHIRVIRSELNDFAKSKYEQFARVRRLTDPSIQSL